MAAAAFQYQNPFPLSEDKTPYRLLSREFIKEEKLDGQTFLKVEAGALRLLARQPAVHRSISRTRDRVDAAVVCDKRRRVREPAG